MKPIKFKEGNKNLLKPHSMTDEECLDLPIFSNGVDCISKWKMSWRERLHCLFMGWIWLSVRSGKTQPPVWISTKKNIFKELFEE